ncbi:hypothetical protein ACX40Y_14350 [Sphingomonas sp. RS6]
MSRTLTKMAPLAVLLTGAVALGGCASKSFVREQIAPVSQRVDALEARLQETDGTAKAALQQAQAATGQAQAAAGQAQANTQRLDQLTSRVDTVEQRQAEMTAKRKRPRN